MVISETEWEINLGLSELTYYSHKNHIKAALYAAEKNNAKSLSMARPWLDLVALGSIYSPFCFYDIRTDCTEVSE